MWVFKFLLFPLQPPVHMEQLAREGRDEWRRACWWQPDEGSKEERQCQHCKYYFATRMAWRSHEERRRMHARGG